MSHTFRLFPPVTHLQVSVSPFPFPVTRFPASLSPGHLCLPLSASFSTLFSCHPSSCLSFTLLLPACSLPASFSTLFSCHPSSCLSFTLLLPACSLPASFSTLFSCHPSYCLPFTWLPPACPLPAFLSTLFCSHPPSCRSFTFVTSCLQNCTLYVSTSCYLSACRLSYFSFL
jgi:hypothetical protein